MLDGIPLFELHPGDVVRIGASRACFVGRIDPHPLWPNMSLIIWRLDTGAWSMDCLNPAMIIQGTSDTVGKMDLISKSKRARALRNALTVGV